MVLTYFVLSCILISGRQLVKFKHKLPNGIEIQVVRCSADKYPFADMDKDRDQKHLDGLSLFEVAIWINSNTRGRGELDTWIHEILHQIRPKLSEKSVASIAGNITDLLWRVGYRKKK